MRADHPGVIIEDFIHKWRISRRMLAARIGVNYEHLTDVINGDVAVSVDMALLLGQAFGNGAEFWMFAQAKYELEKRKEFLIYEGKFRRVRRMQKGPSGKPTDNDRCLCGHFAWEHVELPLMKCFCGCERYIPLRGYLHARRRGDVPAPEAPREAPPEPDLIDEDPA